MSGFGPFQGGGGNASGPTSSTDNAVARFDGTTGRLLQNSVVTVGDTGDTNFTTASNLYAYNASVRMGYCIGGRFLFGKTGNFSPIDTAGTTLERGAIFSNYGTAGQVICTLPSAVGGSCFGFMVTDAQNFRIQAAAGDIIRIGGNVGTAAGYTESSTVGSVLWLTAIDGTYWFAEYLAGTWSNPT